MEPPAGSLIRSPASILERLDLAALFPKRQPLQVELGSGDGSFLANYAQAHPEQNFIGVERLLGRLRKIEKKGRRSGLTNLALFRLEASYVLEYMIPRGAVSALHVYFPDPWPKRKHRKNRLINEAFTVSAAKSLQKVGRVYLRTDDQDYFEQMRRVFGSASFFEEMETPAELAGFVTDFERTFQARGIQTLRAAYALKG